MKTGQSLNTRIDPLWLSFGFAIGQVFHVSLANHIEAQERLRTLNLLSGRVWLLRDTILRDISSDRLRRWVGLTAQMAEPIEITDELATDKRLNHQARTASEALRSLRKAGEADVVRAWQAGFVLASLGWPVRDSLHEPPPSNRNCHDYVPPATDNLIVRDSRSIAELRVDVPINGIRPLLGPSAFIHEYADTIADHFSMDQMLMYEPEHFISLLHDAAPRVMEYVHALSLQSSLQRSHSPAELADGLPWRLWATIQDELQGLIERGSNENAVSNSEVAPEPLPGPWALFLHREKHTYISRQGIDVRVAFRRQSLNLLRKLLESHPTPVSKEWLTTHWNRFGRHGGREISSGRCDTAVSDLRSLLAPLNLRLVTGDPRGSTTYHIQSEDTSD